MSDIEFERDGEIAIITLNRPEKLNAWTGSMRELLIERIEALRGDESVRAVIFTGAGRAFCAGQDLGESALIDPEDHEAAEAWIDGFERLYRAVLGIEQITIAAVNGVAAGSGFQFALLADLRVGDAEVRMGQPEVRSGIPSITGAWVMSGILGRAKTAEFVLTGDLVDGVEAHRLNLLSRLVAPGTVREASRALACRLAQLPPGAVRLTKDHLRSLDEEGMAAAFAAAKAIHRVAYASGEPQQQMRKFLAERSAR
ncbi:enoyl-CoA hydratase/isomerase family protein [Microbacterium sp.]|uniref:enoyl-CoA hydratase/isomerase family protein n=1 Tax=Microbacterium sp. TaxID=51671 RepID=UPI0039E3B129